MNDCQALPVRSFFSFINGVCNQCVEAHCLPLSVKAAVEISLLEQYKLI
jgi:hypothetical protein